MNELGSMAELDGRYQTQSTDFDFSQASARSLGVQSSSHIALQELSSSEGNVRDASSSEGSVRDASYSEGTVRDEWQRVEGSTYRSSHITVQGLSSSEEDGWDKWE